MECFQCLAYLACVAWLNGGHAIYGKLFIFPYIALLREHFLSPRCFLVRFPGLIGLHLANFDKRLFRLLTPLSLQAYQGRYILGVFLSSA